MTEQIILGTTGAGVCSALINRHLGMAGEIATREIATPCPGPQKRAGHALAIVSCLVWEIGLVYGVDFMPTQACSSRQSPLCFKAALSRTRLSAFLRRLFQIAGGPAGAGFSG